MVNILAQDLRDAVLLAAMQGKLSETHDDDMNIKDVIDSINNHKKNLINDKIIKAGKSYPIDAEKTPYEIPEAWSWVRISDIFAILNGDRGKNYPSKETLKRKGDIPFISAVNLNNVDVSVNEDLLFVSEEQYQKLNAGHLKKGDAVVCIRGSLGKHGVFQFERGAIASSLVILRQYSNEYDFMPFLFLFLDSPVFYSQIKEYDNGTAQPNLAAESLKQFYFPLPPVEEQARIVAHAEDLMARIDEYENYENKLAELKQDIPSEMKEAVLQAAMQGKLTGNERQNVSKHIAQIKKEKELLVNSKQIKNRITESIEDVPFDIPDEWQWTRFGDIVDYRMGKTPPRKEYEWWKNDIPWVSIADMPENGHVYDTSEMISEAAFKQQFKERISPKGTLLMSFKLTVGKVSILDIDAVHNEAIISIFPFCDPDNITRDYLFKILPMMSCYGETKNAIKGKTLNDTSLSNLLIPLPPLSEQKAIVDKLDSLLPLCDELAELA